MGLTRIRAEQISDIDYKQAVRVITLSNITLSGGAPNTVDDVNLAAGDRILVAGQDTGSQNGLYYVATLGTGSNGTWTRTADGDVTGEIEAGMIVMVTEGEIYKDSQWKLITNNPIVVGSTVLVFEQSTPYAFGNISANGTAILANALTNTVFLAAGDNISIIGDNSTKIITITGQAASPIAISSGTSNVKIVSPDGDVTLNVNGTSNTAVFSSNTVSLAANLLPTSNVIYNLGSPDQRWNQLWLNPSTIYLGDAQLSANSTSLVLTNPDGGNMVLSGSSSDITASTISAIGNIIAGNIYTEGLITAVGNIIGGNIVTTGTVKGTNIDSTNADVAEKYLADSYYPPGTVLEIGGSAEVRSTSRYASTKIIGVVSTAPALLMNESQQDSNSVEVALLGRVPCRVIGPIHRGDLLTSSDQIGVATALDSLDYKPGCVIGKALQSHASNGEGMIEVLVGRL